MLDSTTIHMLVEGTGATLYMTLLSTFFGYVLGLPIGIILTITDKEGIKPNAIVYKILDFIVNILRSIPFLILLILLLLMLDSDEDEDSLTVLLAVAAFLILQ